MRKTVEQYLRLYGIWGPCSGSATKSFLIELKEQGSGIVAIENAHISGPSGGRTDGPASPIYQGRNVSHQRFQANYTGICNGKTLRGSTYFIKEGTCLSGCSASIAIPPRSSSSE
jgi:predicted transcriptional regulator YheO